MEKDLSWLGRRKNEGKKMKAKRRRKKRRARLEKEEECPTMFNWSY